MLVFARTAMAAIVFGILAFAGAGAMPGPTDAEPIEFEERWGDQNCKGTINGIDALLVLWYLAGHQVFIPEGICEDGMLFFETVVQIEGGPEVQWSDVDCSGNISAVDALRILRHVVGLPVPGFAGCPEMGAMTTLSPKW